MGEGLLQPIHLVVILGLALLFFGPSKLPELGKGIGDGIRNFKKGMSGEDSQPPTEPKA
jgi:sec-independent protein translocase protein TatA